MTAGVIAAKNNLTRTVDTELEDYEANSYQNRPSNINYRQIAKYDISWENTSFLDISIILKRSLNNLERHNFYLPLQHFSNCLSALMRREVTTAQKEILDSFNLIRQNKNNLNLGGYAEYILAFYVGLNVSKKNNLLELKKIARYLLPIASDGMTDNVAKSLISISKKIASVEVLENLYVSIYVLYVIGKFNCFCIKKNRQPQLVNNPYDKLLSPFKAFINAIIFNQAMHQNLEQAWEENKPNIKNKAIFLDKKMPYIGCNIINILNNPSEHFAIFNSLYLDAYEESRYVYHLLAKDSEPVRIFILNKLNC